MGGLGYWVLLALWIAWLFPFAVRRRGGGQTAAVTARSARWGMILEGIGFAVASVHLPSQPAPSTIRIAMAIVLAAPAILLGFWSTSALGKQWRFDAALNLDHHLIQTGPYAFLRHPIYGSMLLMLIANTLILSNWIFLCIALVFYFVGTEIRVRTEEELLIGRFGERYQEYRRQVSAYLPGIR